MFFSHFVLKNAVLLSGKHIGQVLFGDYDYLEQIHRR